MIDDEGVEALRGVIRHAHGCESVWSKSVSIVEMYGERAVWTGDVQVFGLIDHPTAKQCYAWSHELESGKRKTYAVLHSPPVDSARKAVQAAIVQDARIAASEKS